jgi:N-acetylglucosaminyldiphosphoundecaprenol N-acetyl-beta-D-mannosaminyltransferase
MSLMRKVVGILGVPVDILNMEAALDRMEQFITVGGFHQVATANTDFVTNSLSDPELRSILQTADLITPDGMPVVWASRLLRAPLPERVTGADIVPKMAERAARHGWRIFLLGAKPDVARAAAARLETDYPGIQIVGCLSPPSAPLEAMDDAPILAAILRARPDILLVAFGNPKQEKWIARHREQLRPIPICMGVGGTFDFLASQRRRAPRWMQRRGLEWLFRLLHEPSRLWKRYSRDLHRFGVALVRQAFALHRCRPSGRFVLDTALFPDCTLLTAVGDLAADRVEVLDSATRSALARNHDVVLDLRDVTLLDGAALGALIEMQKEARAAGRQVSLVCMPGRIEAILHRAHLFDGLYTAGLSLPACTLEVGNEAHGHKSMQLPRRV